MARGRSIEDIGTLQMALVGFQIEKQRIESKIQEIRSQLKGRGTAAPAPAAGDAPVAKKRELSEAARKRIAMAQKRRWAEHRKRAAAAKAQSKQTVAKAGGASAA